MVTVAALPFAASGIRAEGLVWLSLRILARLFLLAHTARVGLARLIAVALARSHRSLHTDYQWVDPHHKLTRFVAPKHSLKGLPVSALQTKSIRVLSLENYTLLAQIPLSNPMSQAYPAIVRFSLRNRKRTPWSENALER